MNTKTNEQPCGCKTIAELADDGTELGVNYVPCLACALTSAGLMLQEAASRLREAEEERLAEAAEQAERLRVQAEDWIGGTD